MPALSNPMSFEQSRRVQLINLFSILAAISAFPFLFIFSGELDFLKPISIVAIFLFLSCIYFNRIGYFKISRYVLLLSVDIYIFITASTFGRASGDQLVYIPIIFGAVLVYDFSEKISLAFTILFTIGCLVLLEYTGYNLLHVELSPTLLQEYYTGNMIIAFVCSIVIALFYFRIYASQNIRNQEMLFTAKEIEKTINYFSTSLYGKNTEAEIYWDIAKNCISKLGFQDCVIYVVDHDNNRLIQKAAYGPKNPKEYIITNSIEISIGNGIVGHVAKTGVAEIISDTSKDRRYIVDDVVRLSEISVPIIYHDKVIGIIDSEHPDKNFFTESHLSILNTIAALCSNKIIKARAEEEKIKATLTRLEAEKVMELDKVKTRFFTNISHEFRTPLTLILAPLEDMIREERNPEALKQLKLMQSSARKLLRLINDMLELSKLDEGVLNLELTKEDIFLFIRTVLSGFHSLAEQRNIQLNLVIPSYTLLIEFDKAKIETILVNLISRGLLSVPSKSNMNIGVSLQNDCVEIKIETETKTESDSKLLSETEVEISGIGLSLSKELAKLHGGSLEVEYQNKKNSFIVTIPTESKKVFMLSPHRENGFVLTPHKEAPKNSIALDLDKKNVALIVEDNSDLRNYLTKILKKDYTVLEATEGEQGLQMALQHVPDLIISDVMMPVLNGIDMCRKLKEMDVTSHIPVLLLTAKADMESKLEGLQTGADYYLAKPFEARELLAVAANLIEQRKKLKDYFSKTILLKSETWEGSSADERFLQKLMSIVESHLSEPDYTIEALQKEIGISRMQLHRKLKALTDLSATEFIRSIRLKRAAEMIHKGQDNVSQIAYQCGFNSLSYFTKCFKEQFGSLPSSYQKKTVH